MFETTVKPAFRFLTRGLPRRIFGSLLSERTPIFMLHRLHDPERDVSGHTIQFLTKVLTELRASGAEFVSLRTLVKAWKDGSPLDPNWVAFTIDDGFADQAILAREVFARMNCPVTIFLISGFLDRELWPWDDQLGFAFRNARVDRVELSFGHRQISLDLSSASARHKATYIAREHCKKTDGVDPYAFAARISQSLGVSIPGSPPEEFRPMSWDNARELEREGVEFGPHSVTHRIFSRLPREAALFELQHSWDRLRQELSNPLPIFAWPTGRSADFSPRDLGLAQEIGLHASMAADPDYAHRDAREPGSAFRINRFSMPTDLDTALRYGTWLERGRQLLPL